MVKFARKIRDNLFRGPDGRFMSPKDANRLNGRSRRDLIVKQLAEHNNLTHREIKARIKGISTEAITGRFIGRDLAGRPRYIRDTPRDLRRAANRAERRGDNTRARMLRRLADDRAKFSKKFNRRRPGNLGETP